MKILFLLLQGISLANRAGNLASQAGQAGKITIATHRPAGPVRLSGPGRWVELEGDPSDLTGPAGLTSPVSLLAGQKRFSVTTGTPCTNQ